MDRLTITIDDRALSDTELDASALALRQELLGLPVHDVQSLPAGVAPPGARVVDVTVLGGLVVMLNSSVALLASLVTAIRAWRRNTIPDSTVPARGHSATLRRCGLRARTSFGTGP